VTNPQLPELQLADGWIELLKPSRLGDAENTRRQGEFLDRPPSDLRVYSDRTDRGEGEQP
jgi:hypothetical protein